MVSHLYKMNRGIPGNVSRPQNSTVEQAYYNTAAMPTAFGVAVKYVGSLVQQIGAGDVASSIQGLLVRPYPTSGNGTDGLGTSAPNSKIPADILKRGWMDVLLGATAAPSHGSPVYVRVANANSGANKLIGDFEAAADTGVTYAAGLNTSGAANTGNGTVSNLSAPVSTPGGAYVATFTSATKYTVADATGAPQGNGVAGTQTTLDNGLSFLVTAGSTPFASGDQEVITVAQNTLLLPGNSYWMGPADAAGNGEIAFNI